MTIIVTTKFYIRVTSISTSPMVHFRSDTCIRFLITELSTKKEASLALLILSEGDKTHVLLKLTYKHMHDFTERHSIEEIKRTHLRIH